MKIVKKNRRIRIEGIVSLVFVLSLLMYFASVTLLHSYNVVLSSQETQLEHEIGKTKNDVLNLELEVKKLANRDRIIEIAEKHELRQNESQIVSVVTGENE
ncbi:MULTISPECIES: hypothetical protein [Breznakia]|uniref:Cell division protein FtsL n=1 Tax=Breznakia blatticola TaxID=1754012 RepID=A0A4R7ZBA1_9FIRM|nr:MULTISPECIES: hypothetical protein [Breznakia]MDH6366970.1 cell division protein FtsL [Breznakia sp. PH1-1]MDH6404148.1 cell division protein FtsL [Breznakia sp. PF1-11]MDH6411857.1 cell division protein FtsL [Breznakia sp. PFB1-11]MDH6414136.1 cell division protein FtsL [Breznakia sp. PFB1-14]MDH6416507.1 cell division protein FtsL [Breznakia sp. PFB1-4]